MCGWKEGGSRERVCAGAIDISALAGGSREMFEECEISEKLANEKLYAG